MLNKKGKSNTNADALSRREYEPTNAPPPSLLLPMAPVQQFTSMVATLTNDRNAHISEHKEQNAKYIQLNSLRNLQTVMSIEAKTVQERQREDPFLSKFIDYLCNNNIPTDMSEEAARNLILESQDYVIDPDDKMLYHLYYPRGKGTRAERVIKQLVIPNSLKHDVMLSYHDSLMAGHQGFDRTYHLIRLKYFWPAMYKQIKQYVASCKECQLNKAGAHQNKVPLKPLPCDGVFKRIHIDLFGPLPNVKGFKYVLLVVDAFSKWPEAFPVKTLTGAEIATVLYSEIICRWGAPYALLSDRGSNFMSSIVKELCKIFEITKLTTSSWHP